MNILLIVVGLLCAVAGLFTISNATLGVGLICLAVFFAVLARINQASEQHRELKQHLKEQLETQTRAFVDKKSDWLTPEK